MSGQVLQFQVIKCPISKDSLKILKDKGHSSCSIDVNIEELYFLQMTDGGGNISREDFVDYAKKSAAVKELTDKGFALVGKQPSGAATKASLDKAELAFKVGSFIFLMFLHPLQLVHYYVTTGNRQG